MLNRTERQELAVEKWIKAGCRATWCFCTGFGKTRTAIIALNRFFTKNPQKQVVVIVPTINLKNQWIKVLNDNEIFFNIDIQVINSAVKRPFYVDFLIIDEVHAVVAPTLFNLFQVCTPKLILGLTATFDRLDGKHVLLNQYCPICDTITVKEAQKNGWLSNYNEYKVMIDVDNLEDYQNLNAEFMNHFAFFDYKFDIAMACVAGIKKGNKIVKTSRQCIYEYAKFIQPDPKFEKQIISETAAHAFAWSRALKERKAFVMNHPKKREIAELILEHRKDSKAITFNSTIKECEKFKVGYVVHSGNTKKKNKLTIDEFSELDVGVIHSSKSLTEGKPGKNYAL